MSSDSEHSIKLVCMDCSKEFDYTIALPTAVKCPHCGMISEARLLLHRSKSTPTE